MITNAVLRTCEIAARHQNVEILDADFVVRQLIAERIFTAKAYGYTTCSITHSIVDHAGVLQHCDIHANFNAPYAEIKDKYSEPVFYFVYPKNATELDLSTFFKRVIKNSKNRRRPDCIAVIKIKDII